MSDEKTSALVRRWLAGAPTKSRFTLTRSQLRALLAEIDGVEERPVKSLGRITRKDGGR